MTTGVCGPALMAIFHTISVLLSLSPWHPRWLLAIERTSKGVVSDKAKRSIDNSGPAEHKIYIPASVVAAAVAHLGRAAILLRLRTSAWSVALTLRAILNDF